MRKGEDLQASGNSLQVSMQPPNNRHFCLSSFAFVSRSNPEFSSRPFQLQRTQLLFFHLCLRLYFLSFLSVCISTFKSLFPPAWRTDARRAEEQLIGYFGFVGPQLWKKQIQTRTLGPSEKRLFNFAGIFGCDGKVGGLFTEIINDYWERGPAEFNGCTKDHQRAPHAADKRLNQRPLR